METPFFELRGISKYFAKVVANKDVSFSINRGEVLALLGENGAGKSTCMKILYGLYSMDEGKLYKDGKEISIDSPRDAMHYRISMIQQHFSLVAAHTVTENIILGNVTGKIDWKQKEKEIAELATTYGFEIDPKAKIRDLAVGQQQKVEILKALYLDANLLIMDEPTAVLTPQEIDNLMEFVRTFVAKGNAIIFITHKLKEVMAVADRIIVMRNGRVFGDVLKAETTEEKLSQMMIGHQLETLPATSENEIRDKICLSVDGLTIEKKGELPKLQDVSFAIHEGEIFGIAGVSGNGQQELCMAICGAEKPTKGTIRLEGQDITHDSIRERIEKGIGYVPSDRQRYGMIMDMTLSENIFLKSSYSNQWSRHGWIRRTALNNRTQQILKDFDVKAPGPSAIAHELSGGNQQKVIVGREVYNCGSFVIFDQPTRGLDLGAIHNVHAAILHEKEAGKAIMLVSTELSEIFMLCDRIAVLYKGQLQGIYRASQLDTTKIGLLMAGYSIEGDTDES
jgi:simple sugar transport system ATP-binding protein